jgi:hypothetical protein
MKKLALLTILISSIALSGCSEARGRANVMAKFPGAEVTQVPGQDYAWLIRQQDGSVWYAIANGTVRAPEDVNDIVQILPPR